MGRKFKRFSSTVQRVSTNFGKANRKPLFLGSKEGRLIGAQDRVFLENKAKILLIAIEKLKSIFVSHFPSADIERLQRFSKSMESYVKRCEAVLQDACNIDPRVSESEEVIKNRDENKLKLETALETFNSDMLLFFDGLETIIQENIMKSLKDAVEKSSEKDAKKVLQRIKNELDKSRKIKELDNHDYNPKADDLLNLYFIAKTIAGYYTDRKFLIPAEQKSSETTQRIAGVKRAVSSLMSSIPKSKKSGWKASVISDEDVYTSITIDDELFPEALYNYSHAEEALLEFINTTRTNLEQFRAIKNELLYIIKNLSIKASEKKKIQDFVNLLELYLPMQNAFYNRTKALYDELHNSTEHDSPIESNQKAIDCFFAVAEMSVLKEQKKHLLPLIEYAEQIDVLLKQDQKKYEKAHLPTICGQQVNYKLQTLFMQLCTRREIAAKELFKNVVFGENGQLDKAKKTYKEICFFSSKMMLIDFLKKEGYIRPVGLKKQLEELKPDTNYSLTKILMQPDSHHKLNKAFLLFLKKEDSSKAKVSFFKTLYSILNPRRGVPVTLEDLMPLRHYFGQSDPLRLGQKTLQEVINAFNLDEPHDAIKIKHIIVVLMPVLKKIQDDLEKLLEKFQFSYDILGILPEVSEIQEKLKGAKTLSALNRVDIDALPIFWRRIFTDERSVLVGFFSEKKALLGLPRDVPNIVATAVTSCANSEVDHKVIQNQNEQDFYREITEKFNLQLQAKKEQGIHSVNMRKVAKKIIQIILEEAFHKRAKEFADSKNEFLRTCYRRILENEKTIIKAILQKITETEGLLTLLSSKQDIEPVVYNGGLAPTAFEQFCDKIKDIFRTQVPEELNKQMKQIEQNQFLNMRREVAKAFLEKEIERQIDLIESTDIFHGAFLAVLKQNKAVILRFILEKLPISEIDDRTFLAGYTQVLLEVPLHLIEALQQNFTEKLIDKKDILDLSFYEELKKLNNDELVISVDSLKKCLAEVCMNYRANNKDYFKEMEGTVSIYELFDLIKNKQVPVMYPKIKEKILALNSHAIHRHDKSRNTVADTPLKGAPKKEGDRPFPKSPFQIPPTPVPAVAVSCTARADFQTLVTAIEQEAVWVYYVKKDDVNSNFVKIYDLHNQKTLVFTAQRVNEDNCLTAHRHQAKDVTTAVAIMKRTVQPTAKRAILEIDINASPQEASVLMQEYVNAALKRKLFPKVTINNERVLELDGLYRELCAVNEPLAREYQTQMGAQNPRGVLQSNSVFLSSAPSKEPSVFLTPAQPVRQKGQPQPLKRLPPPIFSYATIPKMFKRKYNLLFWV